MRKLAPILLLVTALLAGCAAQEDTGSTGTSQVEPIPDAGSILGAVVDDSTQPLSGATVAILSLQIQVQTDDVGGFELTNIPPGRYTIDAVKLGYTSSAKQVDVLPNQPTTGAVITLAPVPVVVPYQETFGPFAGYFECHIGGLLISSCAGDTIHRQESIDDLVFPNNKRFMQYTLSSDNWETMWGEARWSPAAAGTASGMAVYPSYLGRWAEDNGGHWWCEADGESPIWFRFDADEERSVCNSTGGADEPAATMEANPLVLVADPGFANVAGGDFPVRILYQQRFEFMMTVFYGEPSPAEFSAFPDA